MWLPYSAYSGRGFPGRMSGAYSSQPRRIATAQEHISSRIWRVRSVRRPTLSTGNRSPARGSAPAWFSIERGRAMVGRAGEGGKSSWPRTHACWRVG